MGDDVSTVLYCLLIPMNLIILKENLIASDGNPLNFWIGFLQKSVLKKNGFSMDCGLLEL